MRVSTPHFFTGTRPRDPHRLVPLQTISAMVSKSPGWVNTVVLCAVFVTGCASRPIAEWQASDYAGPIDNVLIIGASPTETTRRLFEDTFVRELEAAKVRAISSAALMPAHLTITRSTVEAAIEGEDVDAVLVTRLLGVEEQEQYRPPTYYPHYRRYYGYYSHALTYEPGYYEKYKIVKLETNVYDTTTRELVWSMQSQSIDPSTPQEVIENQIGLVIERLSERGLLSAMAR